MSARAVKWGVGIYAVGRIVYSLWAMLIVQMNPLTVTNLNLYGTPVVAVFDQRTSARGMFSPQVDGRLLHFRPAAPNFTDLETGTVWDVSGRSISGPLAGRSLSSSSYTAEAVFPYRGVAASNNPLLAPWQKFDANWYLAIARRGYGTIPGDTHFPPLYPVLISLLVPLVGDPLLGAILISNLALVAALVVFFQYTSELFDETVAKYASVCLVAFPTAFFLFGAYAEAPFLLAAILALYAIHREQWHWAGVAIFLGILLRLQGIALLLPFVFALFKARGSANYLRAGIGLVAGLAAVPIYLLMRYAVGGSGVLPTAEPELFARLVPPWDNFIYAFQVLGSGQFHFADVLNLIITLAFLIFWVIGWKRLPATWNLYVAATFAALTIRLVETQPLNSMSRYALTLFPIFVLFGMWAKNRWLQRAILYPSLGLSLFLSAQFVLWGWVG